MGALTALAAALGAPNTAAAIHEAQRRGPVV
jgi:hypothetical protein